jgi:hypothetical protein
MIGSSDKHHVNVLAIQQVPVVLEDPGRAPKAGSSLFADVAIHIADSDNVPVRDRFLRNHRPLVAQANRSNTGALVRRRWFLLRYGSGLE